MVMKFLYWSTPAITVLIVSLVIGENVMLHADNPLLFHYSYCRKTPFPLEIQDNLIIYNLWITLFILPILFAVLILNSIIIVKHTKIESRATVHVISGHFTFNRGHERNVVSVMGHFLSHVATFAYAVMVLLALNFLSDTVIAATIREISVFLIPCVNFYLYPFIETLFTGNLRASLFGVHFANIVVYC